MMIDRWMEEELRITEWLYTRKKTRIGSVVGALWIFIMTLVDMFYSYLDTFSRSLCENFFGFAIYPHTCPMPMHNIANTNA